MEALNNHKRVSPYFLPQARRHPHRRTGEVALGLVAAENLESSPLAERLGLIPDCTDRGINTVTQHLAGLLKRVSDSGCPRAALP